jgi:hypothetical protein
MAACNIDGCRATARTRGWCSAHYQRWRRSGNPNGCGGTERGAPRRFYERVVLSYDDGVCLAWPFARLNNGYPEMRHNGSMVLVSRLVCEAEHGPPPTPRHYAAHSCGNGHRGCVNRRHLRWATPAENHDDMIVHGNSTRGIKNPQARLDDASVHRIRTLAATHTQKQIAAMFGVRRETISKILLGKRWAWLSSTGELTQCPSSTQDATS